MTRLRGATLRVSMLASALALLLAAGPAAGELVRDRDDTPGPLDLVQVKFGQQTKRLSIRLRTADPLPSLAALEIHPSSRPDDPSRYVCVRFKSHATGRRLLCPGGEVRHGRIEVGISAVTKKGRNVPRGAVVARARHGRRDLAFDLNLRRIGLRPGRLSFGADSAWYGPACRGSHPAAGHGLRQPACIDRAPQRNSGKARIYPLKRVGCQGFSQKKVFNGSRQRDEVALTFDDGPSEYTSQVLAVLASHHVHGTFFQIGEQVPAYASLVDKIVVQGNDVADHSLRHENGPGEESIRRTRDLIEAASGFRPCMFRPPYGYEPSSTLAAAEALKMVSVIWDVDTRDWTRPGSGAIYASATSVQPGSIVLMHDGGGDRSQTVAALPRIIENLRSRGYHLVTLTRLLRGRYAYAEDHGRHRVPRLPRLGPFPPHREGP